MVALTAAGGVGFAKTSSTAAQYQYGGKGTSGKKVTICHKDKVTITISKSALPAHKAHGDWVGTCNKKKAKADAKAKAEAKAKAHKAEKEKDKAEAKSEKKAEKSHDEAHGKSDDAHGKSDKDHGKGQGGDQGSSGGKGKKKK
jgi:hypothetical protein